MGDLAAQLRTARKNNSLNRSQLDDAVRKAEDLERENTRNRLAALEAQAREQRAESARFQVSEQLTYHPGSEHSFFLDAARAFRLHDSAAQERLDRHQREMDIELPRRREARSRLAAAAYERAFAGTPRDQERLSRMQAAGVAPFEGGPRYRQEVRAMSRSDGAGGYFSPPIFLVDRFVEFAREASPFASLWTNLPLPLRVSQVNAPRIALGAATGPQTDAGPGAGRDIQDSLAAASVRTVAGIADVSRQWFEQGQGGAGFGVDDVIWQDLTADLAQNVDGQCLLGNDGSVSQLLGVWPGGAIAAANGIVVADSNNASSQTWTSASSGTSLHAYIKQTASLARRLRNRSYGTDDWAWFWHPWTWELYLSAVNGQNQPIYGAASSPLPPGAVGHYQEVPVYADANIPTTFGGTVAPYMSAISNGQYAAVPGSGGAPNYTPLLFARPKDLYLFSGEVQLQVFEEVLAGSLQVRFRLHQYLASMPHRFVAAAAVGSNVSAGGDVAHATLTWQQTNSLLILSGSGY